MITVTFNSPKSVVLISLMWWYIFDLGMTRVGLLTHLLVANLLANQRQLGLGLIWAF
jgi:hypothetical protein